MTKNAVFILISFIIFGSSYSQSFQERLFNTHEKYVEKSLKKRRIKHADIQTLISKLKIQKDFAVQQVGQSIGGKPIHLISFGEGNTNIFLWSQMHGNEPTATMALFDLLNLFTLEGFENEKKLILKNVKIHLLPMLNPDGADLYQRRNLLGIDINRDALRLQSPEAKILKKVRDSLDADFGFNLHDQSIYYNAYLTPQAATMSFLAPAYNYEKSINKVRGNAMKIIVLMNQVLQKYIPGGVGRYNDEFEPRAFGDNIQKWGTSTILIESGGYKNDVEKQFIRKLNFVSIALAISSIADKSYTKIDRHLYNTIPNNDRKLFDLKLTGLSYNLEGKRYVLDIGIQRVERNKDNATDFYYVGSLLDQGDLSTYYGYREVDVSGYLYEAPKVYPEVQSQFNEVLKMDHKELLKQGYAYIPLEVLPAAFADVKFPLHLVSKDFSPPNRLNPGINPTFFLTKNGVRTHAVINGFLIDLHHENTNFKNALILR